MKKIVLKFGFIAGGSMAAFMLLALPFMHDFGNEIGMVIGYASMVLAFLLIYFGVRSYRDTVGGGQVRFLKALAVGTLIGLLGSACYVVTWEVIYFSGDNHFIEEYQAGELEKLRASGATDAEITAEKAEMAKFAESYRNPLFNAAITFCEPLPVALIFALVSAGILSRRRKEAAVPAA